MKKQSEFLWKSRNGEFFVKPAVDGLYTIKRGHVTYTMLYESDDLAIKICRMAWEANKRRIRKI